VAGAAVAGAAVAGAAVAGAAVVAAAPQAVRSMPRMAIAEITIENLLNICFSPPMKNSEYRNPFSGFYRHS
jgi:hypothetical protein